MCIYLVILNVVYIILCLIRKRNDWLRLSMIVSYNDTGNYTKRGENSDSKIYWLILDIIRNNKQTVNFMCYKSKL